MPVLPETPVRWHIFLLSSLVCGLPSGQILGVLRRTSFMARRFVLPGDLLGVPSDPGPPLASDFARHLCASMAVASPMPVVHHGRPPSRVDSRLWDSTHVFARVDAVKRPLVPPYEGPYPVLERSPKTFIILKKEKPLTVTVDRL